MEKDSHCFPRQKLQGRWILVNAGNQGLAWSGSRWVPHVLGVFASRVQVSNFKDRDAAIRYAMDADLKIATSGFVTDEISITCFACGMRSYNPNDIVHAYCGNCHAFHESKSATLP